MEIFGITILLMLGFALYCVVGALFFDVAGALGATNLHNFDKDEVVVVITLWPAVFLFMFIKALLIGGYKLIFK